MQLETEVWLQQSWKTFAQLPQPPFEYSTHQSSHNNSIMETAMIRNHVGKTWVHWSGWALHNRSWRMKLSKPHPGITMMILPKGESDEKQHHVDNTKAKFPGFTRSFRDSLSISPPKPSTKTTIWDLAKKKKNTTSSVTWPWASDMGDGQSPKMPKYPIHAGRPSPLVKVASSSRRCLGAYPIVQVTNSLRLLRKKPSRGSPLNLSSLRWEWW